MLRLLLLFVALIVVSVPAVAETESKIEKYHFDKTHTQILFFVDHLGFSSSQGEFHEYDGYFTFDRDNPEKSSVDVSIKTSSIDMDDEKWDAHMKNEDFFNVETFPNMSFKSTNIEITGEDTANIIGTLTLLGVTKPVTLNVKHNKSGKHPFSGKFISGFSATAMIKRSEFGMNYALPGISDEVEVRLEVEGVRDENSSNP